MHVLIVIVSQKVTGLILQIKRIPSAMEISSFGIASLVKHRNGF